MGFGAHSKIWTDVAHMERMRVLLSIVARREHLFDRLLLIWKIVKQRACKAEGQSCRFFQSTDQSHNALKWTLLHGHGLLGNDRLSRLAFVARTMYMTYCCLLQKAVNNPSNGGMTMEWVYLALHSSTI